MGRDNLIFRQLFDSETSTFTYVLGDRVTRESVIIDSVHGNTEKYLKLLSELSLDLKFVLDTHVHADHITDSFNLRERTGAKVVIGVANELECADILIKDMEEISFGSFVVKALSTPGHTNGCTTYVLDELVFTGDTLLIRSAGRVDFQEGSAENLFESLSKLYNLPEEFMVYPGHDYNGNTSSTIYEEKNFNLKFNKKLNKEEFIEIISNEKLPLPKYIDIAVPSNKICGERVVNGEKKS